MSESYSTNTMRFPLKIERGLFLTIAVLFAIISVSLVLESVYLIGFILAITSGCIIMYYFIENRNKIRNKQDSTIDKPEYTPSYRTYSPCSPR